MYKNKNQKPRFRNATIYFSISCISLFFVFFGSLVSSFAETISYESALTWRADKLGDYVLPDIPASSIYVTNPGVVTKGVIRSITATWQSEGQVQLSVSADDGLHFTPVVNGVPLSGGFTEGTILKWKAILDADSKLTQVRIVYADSSGVAGSFGAPELTAFNFRKSFNISGTEGKPLFNYQVKIKVGEGSEGAGPDIYCGGRLLTDFKDIRFTLADGETILPYYIFSISGQKPGRVAECLLKVPQIPKEGIILYLYYGHPTANSLSNPRATFDFYEDFSKGVLDSDIWQQYLSPGGSLQVSEDGLKIDAASVVTKAFEFKGGILEVAATAETGNEARIIIRDEDPESEAGISQIAYASSYEGAEHCLPLAILLKLTSRHL